MSKPIGKDSPPAVPVGGPVETSEPKGTSEVKTVPDKAAPVETPPKPVSPDVSAKAKDAVASDPAAMLRKAELSKAAGLKTPSAAELKEINDCIKNGDHQKAIDLTIKYYNIDTSGVKGKVTYDSSVSGEGSTSKDRTVKMGNDAFKFGGNTSPAWLASSIMHESLHATQIKERGTDWIANDQVRHSYESEAYDKEIKEAKTTGLTEDMLKEVKRRRKDDHYDKLTEENKKKVDKGDYAGVK